MGGRCGPSAICARRVTKRDKDLHLALNGGLPLAIPGGGFYYIFIAGVPAFRKYRRRG